MRIIMSDEYAKAWDEFLKEQGEDTPGFEVEFATAWDACQREVLKILEQSLHNLDLSTDECDKRYIERIKQI